MANRLVWADSLKGVLMILVVLGHSIQYVEGDLCENNHLWNAIYSFHMPAFMAVSGWLSVYSGNFVVKRRFLQLLVPYFCWSFLWFITDHSKHIEDMALVPDRYYWFLWALFFINILFNASRYLAQKLKLNEDIAVISMGVLLMAIMVVLDFRLFGFQFISYYYLFFMLGYIIHKHEQSIHINYVSSLLLFVLWCFLAWYWNMHSLPSWFTVPYLPATISQFMYRGITASIVVLLLLRCAAAILDSGEKTFNRCLVWIGKYSLCFYTTHLLLVKHLKNIMVSVLPALDGQKLLLESILFVELLTLSYLVIIILKKNNWVEMLFIGKNRNDSTKASKVN